MCVCWFRVCIVLIVVTGLADGVLPTTYRIKELIKEAKYERKGCEAANNNNKTPWSKSESELYRRSDHRLSAK
jgi:hypothetical protein